MNVDMDERFLGRALWICMAIVVLMVLLGYTDHTDSLAQQQAEEATHAQAYERGRARGLADGTSTVRAAYAQGQRDAMAALQREPQGVALLQACRAMEAAR